MPNLVETLRMPTDLPYPQSPNYSCGEYGQWKLKAKTAKTIERGYFTGFDDEPAGHYLVKDGHIWMSTSRLERESHAVHLKYATGNVVVCGVGMGMFLFNIAGQAAVKNIVAVDLDPAVIDLVQHATAFESWPGGEKIRFINKDALLLTADDIGLDPIDYLYIDIWPELGNPEALAQTRTIQSAIEARRVGWWGQEIDFIDWLSARRPKGHQPTLKDFTDFSQATGLPIEEKTAEYLMGCRQAEQVFSSYTVPPFPAGAER
jgi:hypothetical protein